MIINHYYSENGFFANLGNSLNCVITPLYNTTITDYKYHYITITFLQITRHFPA